jgi:hypothetical protein
MRKFDKLKNKMIMELVVASVIVAVIFGISLFASGLAEDAEKDRRTAQAKLQTIRRDTQIAQERLQSSGASIALYDALKKERDEMSLTISRKEITDSLGRLKEKYRLSSLNLQMEPEQPFEDEEIRLMKLSVVKTTIVLEFGGMSDQHLFSFINELRRTLPGFIKVNELSLNREKIFDIEAMRQISQGATPQMVSGTMAFEWYGYPNAAVETAPLITQ